MEDDDGFNTSEAEWDSEVEDKGDDEDNDDLVLWLNQQASLLQTVRLCQCF